MKRSVLPLNFLKRLLYIPIIGVFIFLVSCSESDSVSEETASVASQPYVCATCKTSPEALSQNDSSFEGIYIGVNNFGTVKVDIDNKHDGLLKSYIINGSIIREFRLVDKWFDGSKFHAVFSGRFTEGHHESPLRYMNFNVGLNGENPEITMSGGLTQIVISLDKIYKEKSNEMIEVFDGIVIKKSSLEFEEEQVGLEGKIQTNGRIANNNPVLVQKIGTQRYLVSRSKGYWTSLTAINVLSESEIMSPSNEGVIINNRLIDSKNNIVGSLSNDLLKGRVFDSESNTLIFESKRVF